MNTEEIIAEIGKLGPKERLDVVVGLRKIIQMSPSEEEPRDLWEVLLEYAGKANGDLPEDLAVNHDHYLYGTPKQQP